jgi:hypothetical protein
MSAYESDLQFNVASNKSTLPQWSCHSQKTKRQPESRRFCNISIPDQ